MKKSKPQPLMLFNKKNENKESANEKTTIPQENQASNGTIPNIILTEEVKS